MMKLFRGSVAVADLMKEQTMTEATFNMSLSTDGRSSRPLVLR
jgi:hypothetical protein